MCSQCMQTKVHMAYRRFVYQWVHMWIFSQNYMVKCLSDQQWPQKIIGGYFLDVKANGGCPLKNKDKLRNRKRTWQFKGNTSFVDLCLTSVCYAFVRVCFLMACGHLLGKGWPLGSRLWCLIVSLLLSHWYPGSGVVLDCIDSWSLSSSLLLCTCSNISNISKARRSWWWQTIHIWYKYK